MHQTDIKRPSLRPTTMFQSPSLDLSGLKRSMSRSKGHKPTDSASKEVDTVSPATKTAVALEYASLRHASHCPLGVYVDPSIESLLVWDAVLFVHQGAQPLPACRAAPH